jgi:hypothetical protein
MDGIICAETVEKNSVFCFLKIFTEVDHECGVVDVCVWHL